MSKSPLGPSAAPEPCPDPVPEVAFLRAVIRDESWQRHASSLVLQSSEAGPFQPCRPVPEALLRFCRAVIAAAGLDRSALPDPSGLSKDVLGRLFVAFVDQCHSAFLHNDVWMVECSNGTRAALHEVIQPRDQPTRLEVANLETNVGPDHAQELRAQAFADFVRLSREKLTSGTLQFKGPGELYNYFQNALFGRVSFSNGQLTRTGPRIYLALLYKAARTDPGVRRCGEQDVDEAPTVEGIVEDAVALKDQYERIKERMEENLDPEEQQILKERIFESRSVKEMAKARDISYNAMDLRIRRIINKLY